MRDQHKANKLVYTLRRKILTLVVVLTLALGAFLVASGEARAKQNEPAAGAPQPAAAVPQPKDGSGSLAPPVPAGEVLSPVQTSAAIETAFPQTPPLAPTTLAAPQLHQAPPGTRTTAPAEAAYPGSSLADDTTTTSPIDPAEQRFIADDTGKSSMPVTGGTVSMVEYTAPMPKEEAGTALWSPLAQQQAPAPLVDSKKKNSASHPASRRHFAAFAEPESEPAALFEGMTLLKKNEPLASPDYGKGKVSSYSPGAIRWLSVRTDARHTMLPLGGSGKPVPQRISAVQESPLASVVAPRAGAPPPSATVPVDESEGVLTVAALPARGESPVADDAAVALFGPPDYYATTVSSITAPTASESTATSAAALAQAGMANTAVHLRRSASESAAASVAKALQAFAGLGSAAEESYAASSKTAVSSKGMPIAPQQPSSPSPEPSDYGSFSLSHGDGALSTGWSLMLGVLVLGELLLLRCDFGTPMAWCEPPKLRSALQMPLERPG